MRSHLTVAQYARRNGLTADAVYKQIRQGRLPEAFRDSDGKYRIPRTALGDRALPLDESSDEPELDATPEDALDSDTFADPIPDIEISKAAERYYRAKLAETEYLEKADKLVPLEGIEDHYANHVAEVKTKIRGIASRLKTRLRLTEAQHELVRELIDEALMGLANDSQEEPSEEE